MPERSCSPTSPRCGSAVPPASSCTPPPRTSCWTPYAAPTTPAPRCCCSPAAATWSSPTTASTAPSCTSRPAASTSQQDTCGGAVVTVAAGEPWDALVARAVGAGLGRRRGAVRASPAASARPRSRTSAPTARRSPTPSPRCAAGTASDRVQRTFAAADCGFGYRTSRFKRDPDRYVVLAVTFQLRLGDLSAPVRYAELARTLGVEVGARAPLTEVREAVLALRARQGHGARRRRPRHLERRVVLHQPVARRRGGARCPTGAPRWEQPDGTVKTSAAWLIEHAGFTQGLRQRPGRAVHQAHAGAHQPGRRQHRGPAGAGRRGPARRARAVRRLAGQRAGPGRLRAAGAG